MSSRLATCALANLTRRVGGLSLATVARRTATPASFSAFASTNRWLLTSSSRLLPLTTMPSLLPPLSLSSSGTININNNDRPFAQKTTRTMVTRKKRLARRMKRRIAANREKRLAEARAAAGIVEKEEEVAAPQHEAWVDFQKSISVSGFQTGQTTKARVMQKGESGQKLRDLKRREKLEMRMKAKQDEFTDVKGGEYPTKSLSDEETERLLKEAYAAIPPRAGKRGHKNLKRQKRRWWLVRKIHAKQKRHRIAAHYRRMEKISRNISETRAIKEEAVEVRKNDKEYQLYILRHWIKNLKEGEEEDQLKESE